MFKWIKNYSLIEFREEERHEFRHHDFRMEKLDSIKMPDRMTALGQYFAAAGIWLSEHVMIELPVQDDETKLLILDQVAPHFAHVQRILPDNDRESIRMQNLKPESIALFHRTITGAWPVVEDLYRHHGNKEQLREGRRTLLRYTIENSRLEPYEPEELDDFKKLLVSTYLKPGKEFNIIPLGWKFEPDLVDSIALRFFCGFVPAITLFVDEDTKKVVMLQLTGQDVKLHILIRREDPGQTRVADSFLYLYLTRGLVYVVDLQDQAPVEHWDELKSCTLFQLEADMRFSEFDHTSGERVREGIGLLLDQDTIREMIEKVNRHCRVDP